VSNKPTDSVLNYNRDWTRKGKNPVEKIYCDMSRVCEVEDQVLEWYSSQYFQNPSQQVDFSFFSPLFSVNKVECGGSEGGTCKVYLTAVKQGKQRYFRQAGSCHRWTTVGGQGEGG